MSKLFLACLAMAPVALTACGGEGSSSENMAAPAANIAPVAVAGSAHSVSVAAALALNGLSSSGAHAAPLTCGWILTSSPRGSAATLTGAASAAPTFTADLAGPSIASLMVDDGKTNSAASTVTAVVQFAGRMVGHSDQEILDFDLLNRNWESCWLLP